MELESKVKKIKRMGYKVVRNGTKITASNKTKFHEGYITKVYNEIMEHQHPYEEGRYYEVGDAFTYKGKLAEVCNMDEDGHDHGQGCDRCVLNDGYCTHDMEAFRGKIFCIGRYRADRNSVFFRAITDRVIKRK